MVKARTYDIEKFVRLKKTANTQGLYKTALLDFARFLFESEIRNISEVPARTARAIELLNEHVKDPEIDPVSDIKEYLDSREGKARSTTRTYTTIIRQFYEVNGHMMSKFELIAIKPKSVSAETKDEPITLDILKRMIDASDLHGRMMITVLVSTGCRIGELCQVEIKDLDLDKDPARIHLRDATTKGGEARTVFLTNEARDLIRLWLDGGRDKYLVSATNKGKGLKGGGIRPAPATDKRLLGCTYDTARVMFITQLGRAISELKQDELTRRHLIHIHSTRKYFRTVAVQTMPLDVVEAIMGHAGYLTGSYVRLSEDQLGAAFKKGAHALSISEGQETRAMRERQDHQSDRIAAQDRMIEKMQKEMEKLQHFGEMMESITKTPEMLKIMSDIKKEPIE